MVIGNKTDVLSKRLLDVGQRALWEGISSVKSGNKIGDISYSIQKIIEENGFMVCTSLAGHVIGSKLHLKPQILNYGIPGTGEEIKAGVGLAIEPLILIDNKLYIDKDGFSIRTVDSNKCAHFEHTVLVYEDHQEVITKW